MFTAGNGSELLGRLDSLGASLYTRFHQLGDLADLEMSIKYFAQAMLLTPEGHPDRPRRLDSLGVSLHSRFERLGDLADIDKSIEYKHQAISLTPENDIDRPNWLESLGTSLHTRFQRLDDLADLDKAVTYLTEAMWLTPNGHSDGPRRLHALGVSLHTRFERLGDLADLERSIDYKRQVMLHTPKDHLDRPRRIDSLGVSFHSRFERLGDLVDLESSIEYKRQAVLLTPEDHSDRPKRLESLGTSLHTRFQRLGELTDLDKDIQCSTQLVLLTPKDHLHRSRRLEGLGVSLHTRFQRLGDLADLDKSIEYKHQAMSLTPEGHLDRPRRLDSLGTSLHTRYQRLGDLADLDKSVEYLTQAMSLTPEGHKDRLNWLHDLGSSLQTRFEQQGDLADLDDSIKYFTEAVLLTPEGHRNRAVRIHSLGMSLHARFERLGNIADLDKAIEHSTQAVLLTPEGHPDGPRRLDNLGLSLYTRFQHLDKIKPPPVAVEYGIGEVRPRPMSNDLSESIHYFQRATESSIGPPEDRFRAALNWARLSRRDNVLTVLPAYKRVMNILPQLVWLGTSVESRYNLILGVAGSICTEAATAAIALQDYSLALEWLEEGRSIVWKQTLQLRTPIDDLSAVDSGLATKLKQVSRDLDYASSPKSWDQTDSSDDTSSEQAAQRHHRLAEHWEQLVAKVRLLPGFEAFLHPQKASHFMRSAESGPVVVINVHKSRCDALIIRPGFNKILHIPLRFTSEQAEASRVQMLHFVRGRGLDVRGVRVRRPDPEDEFRGALGMLWKDVVKPIIASLGYLQNPSSGNLPHITWCTTGPLSFLPLHAAGDYESRETTFKYVVSSYTPTLSALLAPYKPDVLFSGILAVGQESTPGMEPLPGTVAELTRLQQNSQGHTVTRLERHLATPSAVMTGMESHSWVHLACHASQNPTNPLESAFYLHGGRLDLATIARKELKNADFAFLSACQTATGDEGLSEEAVHLAAGMLMAGYRSVIATMWSIGDDDAPLVAEKVYEYLLEGGVPDSRRAAVAVHKATACLRAKVGAEAFQKWVPYIHIGQ